MKKYLKYFLYFFFAAICILPSCKKPAQHSIRVKNDSSVPIGTVTLEGSSVVFKDIKAGTYTDYKDIPEGKYTIGGDYPSDTELNISGKGVHQWTIRFYNKGSDVIGQFINDK